MAWSDQQFLREVKTFLFYSSVFWPIHRQFVKRHLSARCERCIISSRIVPLNQNGLCLSCEGKKKEELSEKTSEQDQEILGHFEKTLQELQKKGHEGFDALVLFSGGKDSCYMVERLRREFPSLRMLLMAFDNHFMSPVAVENLKLSSEKFPFPMITVRPQAELVEKMFRYAFLNLNTKGCSGTVDQFDGDLLHDVGRIYASRLKIPVVLSGCSRVQVQRILGFDHFESPSKLEMANRRTVAGIDLKLIFSDEEIQSWWWQGQEASFRPRVIFPHYAWNLNEEFIKKQVADWGFQRPGLQNPIVTNSQLVPLMAMVDIVKFGYGSFEEEFSQMVRRGQADPVFWRRVFEMSEYAARTGSFVSGSVDAVLKKLKLTRSQLGLPQ